MLCGMAQSLSFLLVHVVFSTKDRVVGAGRECASGVALLIWRTVVRDRNGCECFRVGGVADHVHLAVRLHRRRMLAKLVAELKASSSKWLKSQSPSWRSLRGSAVTGRFPSGRGFGGVDSVYRHAGGAPSQSGFSG